MRRTTLPLVTVALLVLAGSLAVPATAAPDDSTSPEPVGTGEAGATVLSPASASVLHVSPSGDDGNDGSSPDEAFETIEHALDEAQPGTVIELAPGDYLQDVRTVRDGRADAPITISGPSDAVVRGAGNTYVVEMDHDHHVLEGFTINGRFGKDRKDGYRKKLIYAQGEPDAPLEGLRVLDMTLTGALDECLRLRYSEGSEIARNRIEGCGLEDFRFDVGTDKNGEGVYIGTSPSQTSTPDQSRLNHVHDNTINGGGECVDIKEAATANLIEDNVCTGQLDPDSGAINVRGNENVVRGNTVNGGKGAGVRLGGATADDGTANDIVGNTLGDNEVGGIKFMAAPQGKVCGNTVTGGEAAVGTFASQFDPTAPCGGDPDPDPDPDPGVPRIDVDFSAKSDALDVVSGRKWKVAKGAYRLAKPDTSASAANANLAVHPAPIDGDFDLSARVRPEATNGPADVAIVFGYQGPDQYCFVRLSEDGDGGVFDVDGGTPVRVSELSAPVTPGRFATVEVVRAGDGLTVSLDGSDVATGDASGCGNGQVGFATRDDAARFDDLLVI